MLMGAVALGLLLLFPFQTWGEQSTGTLDIRVEDISDDAEQNGASVNNDIYDLELGDKICGMRFQNLAIPQGSTITSAYIQFEVDEVRDGITNLTIWGQNHENPTTFSNSNNNISSRDKTTASVSWDNVPEWGILHEVGVAQQSPDLSAIIQEIVDLEDWSSGNAIVFIVEGSGERVAEARKSGYDKAPILHVEFTTDAVERRITQWDDDAEEKRDQNGEMHVDSPDHDFVQDRLVGLRFQDITIPKGAEITRAYIELQSDETDSGNCSFKIDIQLHDNPPEFNSTDDNISNRTLSGNEISWSPVPNFQSLHQTYRTPDLSALVQQIVGRSGWISGYSMVFVLEASSGTRVAESFDGADDHGDMSLAPLLHIEYGEGEVGTAEPIITVDQSSIGASVYEGSNPDNSLFTITNTGTGTLAYQISDDADWLSVSSTSGTIDASNSTDITVTLNTIGLNVGTYEATITITDPNALNNPVEIQVSVTVMELPEELTCGNVPVYAQNLVSPAILILLDISGSMDDMMDISPPEHPQTPDLTAIVQEIIDRPGWDPDNNSMVFIIEGSGRRTAKSFDNSTAEAPLLHVAYSHDSSDYVLDIRVSAGSDDAEERIGEDWVRIDSGDLEMVDDNGNGDQITGIRFQNVVIPAGATINNAYIEFTIDETDSVATSLTIWGEDLNNPPTFADRDDDISNRTKTTASVSWNNIAEWTGVTQEQRIDIAKSVISDLVEDRAIAWGFGTWCNSNPWDDLDDYTIIHEGTKQNTDEHQQALQSAIAAPNPHGGTPFSFSIVAATDYFEGDKADENNDFYETSDCQPKFLIEITDGMGNTGSTIENTRTRSEALADAGVTGIGVGFGLDYADAEQLYVLADVANERGDSSPIDDIYALHDEIGDVPQPFFAHNKQELIDALNTITENVKGSVFYGSAPAPTTSTDLGDMVIVAEFDASRWSGDLDAVSKNENGQWISNLWTASEELPGTRKLWTVTDPDDPGSAAAFTDGTLASDNFQCLTDKPIGDVINSTPVVVGHAPFWYPFDGYMSWARDLNRETMIYVGANDGFLHAFGLSDGEEKWAFLPNNLHAKLNQADDPLFDRCDPEYCHQYYVDGNPIAADVYADFDNDSNKEWRTMLVTGERKGGQAYFALDVTSGNYITHANPTRYLWEFTDNQLGETWSDPAIDRVAIKDVDPTSATAWGVFFGSGYFPVADQQANKEAYIYAVEAHDANGFWRDANGYTTNRMRIAAPKLGYDNLTAAFTIGELVTGQTSGATGVIIAIDSDDQTLTLDDESGTFQSNETLVGSLGGGANVSATLTGTLTNDALASPLMVDMEGDYLSDRIYVGNLYGNMYRITHIGQNMTPQISTLFSYENTSPNENPIRARADFGYTETNGDIWIYFGSGRYESQADKQDNHQQYFFGLKDSLTPVDTYTPAELVSLQAKFADLTIDGESVIVRYVDGSNPNGLSWKLQLYENTFPDGPTASGTERVVSQPLVVGNIVIFTTFIPDENVCSGSGETYVFALDYKTGLPPLAPVFDIDGDEEFDENDKIEINAEKIIPVGKYVGRGRGSKPVVHGDVLFITTTDSGLVVDDDTGEGGQQFFAEKINIPAQKVRLEAWRHQ